MCSDNTRIATDSGLAHLQFVTIEVLQVICVVDLGLAFDIYTTRTLLGCIGIGPIGFITNFLPY